MNTIVNTVAKVLNIFNTSNVFDEKPPGKEFVSIELYKDLKKQNEDLMEMLKQSQSQLNDMIQITTKLTIKSAQGNDAPQDNDVGCADVG